MKTPNRRRIPSQALRERPAKFPNSDSPAIRVSDSVLWATILCAIFAAYLPALHGGLLWDDSSHITGPDLQPLHGLWRIWFDLHATQQYYPLLHSAFWFEHRMWGDAVVGYHLTNIVLHALSAGLVVMIMKRLSLRGAWLAGFVFALHPVQVESVAWISEQKSTLSGVFYLASLLTYLRFDQSRRKSDYLLATGLFVLALLCKTVTATLPAVLLVIFWWLRARIEWKRDVVPLLSWFALGISLGLFTAWVERNLIGAHGRDFLLTPVQRILIAGRVIFFYGGKLLWPANLMFFYPQWKIDPSVWWQWLFPAGILAIGTGLVLAARRTRGPLTSFLLFSGTLFPVLGFLNVYPFRYSYVADHFQYLASLGVIIPVIALLASVMQRTPSGKALTIACSVLLVLVLGLLTWRQCRMYRDVETLYRNTLARNPESWAAHHNLGVLLADLPDRGSDAIAEYQAALRIRPDLGETHNDLGKLLAVTPGRFSDAIAEYQAALQVRPDLAEAHYNLGIALAGMPGRLPDAIAEFRAALQIKPGFSEAHYNLGSVLAEMPDRLSDAIAEYRAALEIRPDFAEAHNNLGIALSRTPGQDAIVEYQAALRIKPDYAEAHMNLANALVGMPGRLPEALAEYQAALQIRPNYAEAHTNLGMALAHAPGRLQDAVGEFRAALRVRPDLAEAHLGLGDALSQIPGQSREAIAEYRAAVRIKPDYASVVNKQVKILRAPQPSSGK